MPKKLRLPSEVAYLLSIVLLAFSVAMITATDYGVSMIVAPAYILSMKLGLTFGQGEYIVQGVLFIVFCLLMKKVKLVYFSSFATGLIYGAVLDFWRMVIPHFNPDITPPGSLPPSLLLLYFVGGMCLTAFAIALFFRVYLYPQIYDFFVKGIAEHFHFNRTRFKQLFDFSCLFVSCAMTLLLFRDFVGVGIGTLVMTVCNGFLIGVFGRIQDALFDIHPLFPRFAAYFDLD